MNKEEYIARLTEFGLDANKYYIISGGSLLMHGLRAQTADIDLKVKPTYFKELKTRFNITKSPKFDYLYNLANDAEIAVEDFGPDEIDWIDGLPVEKVDLELAWKIEHNRPKDQADIRRIKGYIIARDASDINPELRKHVVEKIVPQYAQNDAGHQMDHIGYVIERSLKFARSVSEPLDLDMVYAIAAYHDVGHHIDADNHEKVSANILLKDQKLHDFFNEDQMQIMADAIADHRSTSDMEPRTIYGKIVSSADRNTSVIEPLWRTYEYRKEHTPDASLDEIIEESRKHLLEKFGPSGYAKQKMYVDDPDYTKFLKDITELASDKQRFRAEFIAANNIKV
ncbi:MAG: HD domain-containing protein [Candidatus Saccharibacteria bacterium]|nr:HD domain-containing protein [Candidatus Saccharibacteria bacterium]